MERLSRGSSENFTDDFIRETRFSPADQLMMTGAREEYLAWQSETEDESRKHLDLAVNCFIEIIGKKQPAQFTHYIELEAYSFLHSVPLIEPIVVRNQMPELDLVEMYFRKLVGVFNRVNGSNTLGRGGVKLNDIFALVFLSNYFQSRISGDSDGLAVPAFLDRPLDTLKQRGDPESHGSIFTFANYAGVPAVNYRTCVTCEGEDLDLEQMPGNVSIVSINELSLPGENGVTSAQIISEIYRKVDHKVAPRSELLMDLIDNNLVSDLLENTKTASAH